MPRLGTAGSKQRTESINVADQLFQGIKLPVPECETDWKKRNTDYQCIIPW
ncbi:MAG: hypothetical protein K5856_05115 [Bacteroidaceae bacterium]|nr:hypothetical protein [Bacteroidaceae bacterium]